MSYTACQIGPSASLWYQYGPRQCTNDAAHGTTVLYCMPNRANCVLLVSASSSMHRCGRCQRRLRAALRAGAALACGVHVNGAVVCCAGARDFFGGDHVLWVDLILKGPQHAQRESSTPRGGRERCPIGYIWSVLIGMQNRTIVPIWQPTIGSSIQPTPTARTNKTRTRGQAAQRRSVAPTEKASKKKLFVSRRQGVPTAVEPACRASRGLLAGFRV
jgi:hypothetical protein